MSALLVFVTTICVTYAQHGHDCGTASFGAVADGVDFVALRSYYDRTGNIMPTMGTETNSAQYEGYTFLFVNATTKAHLNECFV